MVYNILDVAKYIIYYSNIKGYFINSYKLQNILYFIQASFLSEKEEPCFKELMAAEDWGIYIKKVLYEYRRYGLSSIFMPEGVRTNVYISEKDRNMIEEVVDECHKYSNNALIEIIRNQKPWKDARTSMSGKISIEGMREYFNETC